MDRKNFFLGIACIAAAMFIFAVSKPTAQPVGAPVALVPVVVPTIAAAKSSSSSIRELAASDVERAVLENGVVRVTFSTRGGAIEQVELLQQPANLERKSNIIFNAGNSDAAMALGILNSTNNRVEPVYSEFRRVDLPASSTPAIAFQGALPDGTKVLRTYALSAADKDGSEPYSIRFTTKVTPSSAGQMPTRVWHSTGSWHHTESDSVHQFLSVLADNDEDLTQVNVSVFNDSSGFFGLGAHKAELEHAAGAVGKPFNWVSSGNQFFASIIHVDAKSRGSRSELVARPVAFSATDVGVQAFAFWEGTVGADTTIVTEGDFFVGPKEYARVAALPDNQVSVLQFSKILGFISFGAICKLLLASMGGVHALLAWSGGWSWGWAIVLLTVIIKLVTWPLTAAQQRTAKKMQQFSAPMAAIREKYKNDSEKLNKEMMKLYQEHQINPFAGCLPIFIQIPIFFGLYTAFQTTVELRLQSFLWINDLAAPDTIFHVAGFGINLLPILMGVTMWLSMRMTPMPSADDTQKTIMYMMAFLFPVICYTLPAALSLYMTLQNLLTMLQAWQSNQKPVEAVVVLPKKKKSS